MNIFFLSGHPRRCARWHCDKHVVKMILEYTQILYTAHHVNGGTARLQVEAPICKSSGVRGYKQHAAKHPSVLWASSSLAHYLWLCRMARCLVDEHFYRFGTHHSCSEHLAWLQTHVPPGLCSKVTWVSDPTPAMPDEFKVHPNVFECYWAYYNGSKRERGLLKWTKRHTPHLFAT